jgi:hypothetical protein
MENIRPCTLWLGVSPVCQLADLVLCYIDSCAVLDLSDECHQALDEGVLSLFGLNIELNKEPDDMASLLWAIIHSDP